MRAQDAISRLVEKINAQADLDGISLSETERKMLCWSEIEPGAVHDLAVNKQFEVECDADEYENKISALLRRSYQRDADDPSRKAEWDDIERALKGRDYYLLVMLQQALARSNAVKIAGAQSSLRDNLIYVGIGLAIVAALVIFVIAKIQ